MGEASILYLSRLVTVSLNTKDYQKIGEPFCGNTTLQVLILISAYVVNKKLVKIFSSWIFSISTRAFEHLPNCGSLCEDLIET